MTVGDSLTIVDGEGGWFEAVLESVNGSRAEARITSRQASVGEPGFDLTIAIGLQKSRNRFEVFLEKAVELGVGVVIPLVTERSEETRVNRRRAEAVLLAAMKQSGRSVLPKITPSKTFESIFHGATQVFVCHEGPAAETSLVEALAHVSEEAVTLAIGPEGGFTEAEIQVAKAAGAEVVSLGNRRLRTETAGIAAAALVAAHIPNRV
jgi:16S rRNA (uracil1498-N3)-methyltransferase